MRVIEQRPRVMGMLGLCLQLEGAALPRLHKEIVLATQRAGQHQSAQ